MHLANRTNFARLHAQSQSSFNLAKQEGNVELYAESIANRGLSAVAQAESLKFKLLGGLAVRRACYGVMRYIMEAGAQGCELFVSGKARGQRAQAMKFRDGLMVKSGYGTVLYIDEAIRHLSLKQGVLGVKVQIMLPHDPTGKNGVATSLSDVVKIFEPKEETATVTPSH